MRLTTLAEFPPTTDGVPVEVAQLDWVCGPVGQTSESDAAEQANFEVAYRELFEVDPDEETFEVLEFKHFGCDWAQLIFTAPGSPARDVALDIVERLKVNVILDADMLEQFTMSDGVPTAITDTVEDIPTDPLDPEVANAV